MSGGKIALHDEGKANFKMTDQSKLGTKMVKADKSEICSHGSVLNLKRKLDELTSLSFSYGGTTTLMRFAVAWETFALCSPTSFPF